MKCLVIIPAYNEEENIEKVINSLRSLNNSDVDVLVVNDCSTDNTVSVLKKLNQKYISLPMNLGIGGAVQTGYKYAFENDYDIAIQIDGDGQHDVSYINDIISPIINDECDMVVGSRYITREGFQSSVARRIGIRILSLMIKVRCRCDVKDVTSGYRAVNKKIIKVFSKSYPTDYPEPETIAVAALSRLNIKEVPVVMKEREFGKSSINIMKSVYYMIKVSIAIVVSKGVDR